MPDPERANGRDAGELPAEFGPWTAAFVIVASMVGTGVLTTSGFTVNDVGSNQLMLGLWVVGAVMAVSGALCLCELSAALPRTGGDYVYLHEAYGPLVAFLSGWVSFLIGFAAPSAAAALSAARYLDVPFGAKSAFAPTIERVLATVLIVVFAAIHVSGRRRTARVQGWITALKLGLLVLFVVAGLVAGRSHFANLADRPPITPALAVTMLSSLVWISYAYIGWNAASYMAGEFSDPQRQLPRAILLGTAGVVVLYLGLNLVYALALSAGDVRAIVNDPSNHDGPGAVAPIAEIAARRLFGRDLSNPLAIAFGLMLLSSLSAYLLTGPRVIYAMASAGQFPAVAARLTAVRGTPLVATVLQTATTLVFVWVGTLASLVQYASIGLSIFSMLAIGAVFVLRVKRPEMPRPFRTPGYPVTPAIYLGLNALLLGAVFKDRGEVSLYALGSILGGVPFYYGWRWLNRGRVAAPVA